MKIPGLRLLRIYGQEIERKEFPIPDRLTAFRERHVSAQLKADEELRDISLHHVIRKHPCPYAEEIAEHEEIFRKEYKNRDAPAKIINKYKKVGYDICLDADIIILQYEALVLFLFHRFIMF